MRIVFVIFLLGLLHAQQASAQLRCHTIDTPGRQPAVTGQQLRSGQQLKETATPPLITIPVVVHILYKDAADNLSREQVFSQIEALNRDFAAQHEDISKVPPAFQPMVADTRIRFALAKTDPEGRATDGIVRRKTAQQTWKQDDRMKFSENGGSDAWDSRYYLNIWVCRLGNGMLGYSSFPGDPPEKDGVVIRTDIFGTLHISHPVYNKGRTATHEIGHWLNLKHLWGDQYCGDDGVDDTPPQSNYNSGCSSYPVVKPGGCNNSPHGDMFMNFMDFSDDACALMFTHGQAGRMQQLFEPSGLRASILSSHALNAPFNHTPIPDDAPVLHLYPNPATSLISLSDKSGAPLFADAYTVFNTSGTPLLHGKSRQRIPVHTLPAGMYFIQVQTPGSILTGRFVKY